MRKVYKWILLILSAFLMTAVVYRYQIFNGFSFEFGVKYDDVIAISLMEHWYNVIFDNEIWSRTQYFYPYVKTIGYSDGLFLLGLVYSFIRFLGIEPILANEIVGIVFHIIGYIAFYIMLRTVWKFTILSSFFAAGVVCLSSNMWTQSVHIQMFVVYLVPLIFMLFYKWWECLRQNNVVLSFVWLSAGSILYGSCLMTGFYLMWFFTFFALIFYVICMFRAENRHFFWSCIIKYRRFIVPVFIVVLIPILPLFYIYIEKAQETGMQLWPNVKYYILPLMSLMNVGQDNIVYHWGMALLPNGDYNKSSEFSVAFTPVFVICILYTIFSKKFDAFSESDKFLWKGFALAIGISVFFTVHVGHFYPWHIVYYLVPGAKSMRVVARFMLFLSLPLSVLFALFLDRMQHEGKTVLCILLGMFVLVEQLNAAPLLNLDRKATSRFYNQLPAPPDACKSFFVIDSPPTKADNDGSGVYQGNVSAMLYAELHHIPTVNGFTTFYPPDWHFDHLYLPDVQYRAEKYAIDHRIKEGFCLLNLEKKKWSRVLFPEGK